MAHYEESTPLDKRQSRNIDVWHYIKELSPAAAAIAVGFVADYIKNKSEPGTAKARMLQIVSVAALAISPFLIWRKKEKEDLGIHDLYDQYKDARALRMNNDDLIKDNAVLKKMVEFEERRHEHPKHVQEIIAQGPRDHTTHAAAEPTEITTGR